MGALGRANAGRNEGQNRALEGRTFGVFVVLHDARPSSTFMQVVSIELMSVELGLDGMAAFIWRFFAMIGYLRIRIWTSTWS